MLVIVGGGSSANFQADRLYKSNDTYQYKCGCGGVKAHKKGRGLASGCCPSLKNAWAFNKTFYVATKASRIPGNLNFLGETVFWRGIFCLEYPSRRSEKVNCRFLNYRLSFRKLQIFISQTTDFHFVSFRFVSLHFVSQTTVSPLAGEKEESVVKYSPINRFIKGFSPSMAVNSYLNDNVEGKKI